jgi:RNA polymerase sigma-70 factor (ECF subfamily)
VQQALTALPDEYRQVVVLRHFAELSYDDIAETLGIPAKTVKSRLYTARQRLIELLLVDKATK